MHSKTVFSESENMRVTPLDFCLRVIENEKPLNIEKTTSSGLSVLFLKKWWLQK